MCGIEKKTSFRDIQMVYKNRSDKTVLTSPDKYISFEPRESFSFTELIPIVRDHIRYHKL